MQPKDGDQPDDFVGNLNRRDAEAKVKQSARKGAQKPRRATKSPGSGGYVAVAISNELELIRNAAPNTRNVTVNNALFNIGTLGRDNIDIEQVKSLVRNEARAIGLPDSEIDLLLRESDNSGLNRGMARARNMTNKTRTRNSDVVRLVPPPTPPTDLLETIEAQEDGFWDSRESLSNIYIAALSRFTSPWAALGICVARALSTVPASITLPPLIGGRGSLNWFGAITAASGGGKGAANAVARELVSDFVRERNTGSGEGMIGAYVKPADSVTGEPKGLYSSVMFNVDEIDSLTAQSMRSGATTMSVLRSAFSGETLGFSYVNKNTPTLDQHSYRMTMIVSVQPQRAAGLLDDAAGGTPQRFMWLPGNDRRVDAKLSGGWISALDLPGATEWMYPRFIRVPKACSDEIVRERVRAMRGESDDPLAGHALFVREKFAFGLSLLDGRTDVSEEDWELSAVAAKVSDVVRYWIGNLAEEARIAESVKRGEQQAYSSMAADAKRSNVASQERRRVEDRILKYLKDAGLEGLPRRVIQRKLADKGTMFASVAEGLQAEGLVRCEKGRWYLVS